jgi:hypothetical protein
VDDLALQVRLVHDVEVHDAEGADTGGGQVEQRGRAQAAGTDDQDLAFFSRFWPVMPTSGMIRCRE